jgi:hypothetical protein
MVASRYQGSFGYAPRMASGSYPGGGPRNALAPVYGAPVGSVGSPVGLPQAPAMQAPMAPAAPSLTSGTGQLRDLAQERYLAEGNGVGFGGGAQDSFDPGDGYGTGGPTGAPSTGNFGQDVMNFGRNAGPAVAGLLGGPAGLVGVIGGIMGAGALRGLGYEQTANALIGNVIGRTGEGINGRNGGPKVRRTHNRSHRKVFRVGDGKGLDFLRIGLMAWHESLYFRLTSIMDYPRLLTSQSLIWIFQCHSLFPAFFLCPWCCLFGAWA